MEAYLKQDKNLFYKIENGKVTAINIERKWIRSSACVPSIYANKVEVISKDDWGNAKKEINL